MVLVHLPLTLKTTIMHHTLSFFSSLSFPAFDVLPIVSLTPLESLVLDSHPSLPTYNVLVCSPAQPPHSVHPFNPLTNTYPMVTKFKNGISKPKLHVAIIPTCDSIIEPTTISQALFDHHWKSAMDSEFNALI